MTLKGIATQEEAVQFQAQLSQLAANLLFHTNNVLDQAHGLNLYGDGTVYTDSYMVPVSHGNASLPNYVRFIVNGTAYFAPCLLPPTGGSDTGGQAPLTSIPMSAAVAASPSSPGETTLVTAFELLTANATQGLEDYLLAHTRLTHEVAHISMSAAPQETLRLSGALVGTHVVRTVVGGIVYEIPCCLATGGPAKVQSAFPALGIVRIPNKPDPNDVIGTFTGIPGKTYACVFKVRGCLECQPYSVNSGYFTPVVCSPVPPNTLPYQFCLQYTGALTTPPHDHLEHGAAADKDELIFQISDPAAIYVLNNAPSASLVDYTFPCDVASGATVRMAYRSMDQSSAQGGPAGASFSDTTPPFLAPIEIARMDKTKAWIQVDLMSAT